MDEKGVSGSYLVIPEDKSDGLYPMVLGVSFAFFALGRSSETEVNDDKWSEIRNRMLQGSAYLLGLLVWRVQKEGECVLLNKMENAEREIKELKRRRSEDAKANEKVLGIFSAQEQRWLNERKRLRQQIGALMNELRVLETKKGEVVSILNEKLHEKELLVVSKDKLLEEEEQKSRELEQKVKKAEEVAEELRDTRLCEGQRHFSELSKHKTAFIELVSNQRQLEAEMGRAFVQVEAAKQEVDSVLEQKEQSILLTQKLSMELVKMRSNLEQKDKILSAMLRKSKLDTDEKQMLLKEVKLSKGKRTQAEFEIERLRPVSESRHERHSLRSMFFKHANPKLDSFSGERGVHSGSAVGKSRSQPTDFLLEYEQSEANKVAEVFSPLSDLSFPVFAADDVKQLEDWVRSEAEKYTAAIHQRHHLEVDAFAEQLRLKDEKLEVLRWRLLSMELESKRMHSRIKGLDHDLKQVRQNNLNLESLLLDREEELHSLKEQLGWCQNPPFGQKINSNSSTHDLAISHNSVWSKVKIIKRKPGEKEQEITKLTLVEDSQEMETKKEAKTPIKNHSKDVYLTAQSPKIEIEEEKNAALDPSSIQEECARIEEVGNVGKLESTNQCLTKKINSPWNMDLHALGVFYKIKRLKQQLIMLERLTGKQESCENNESGDNGHFGTKGFYILMALLNKQVSRYQSLQGKTDDLCKWMYQNNLDVNHGGSSIAITREEIKVLEHFLEDTFQLQSYIVATGQKLTEIQSKISSGLIGAAEELDRTATFDMKRFADSFRTLFSDVQRGLEVRVARIIGDLEGTLACDGIIHLRK